MRILIYLVLMVSAFTLYYYAGEHFYEQDDSSIRRVFRTGFRVFLISCMVYVTYWLVVKKSSKKS